MQSLLAGSYYDSSHSQLQIRAAKVKDQFLCGPLEMAVVSRIRAIVMDIPIPFSHFPSPVPLRLGKSQLFHQNRQRLQ